MFRRLASLPIVTLFLAGSLLASPSINPSSTPAVESHAWDFQGEASALLKEVQSLAGKLDRDASTLQALTRTNQVSWQSHADYLSRIREHINPMGDRLERLQGIKHVTAAWQQQAINRIVPVAVVLATRTQAAIEHLNENRGQLFAPTYADHLAVISDCAGEIKESVDNFLELAETQQKLERLQQRIEVAEF